MSAVNPKTKSLAFKKNNDDELLKSMSTNTLTVRLIRKDDYNMIKFFCPINDKTTTIKTLKKISRRKSDPFLFEQMDEKSS